MHPIALSASLMKVLNSIHLKINLFITVYLLDFKTLITTLFKPNYPASFSTEVTVRTSPFWPEGCYRRPCQNPCLTQGKWHPLLFPVMKWLTLHKKAIRLLRHNLPLSLNGMLTQCSCILVALRSNVTPHHKDIKLLASTKTKTQKGEERKMYL